MSIRCLIVDDEPLALEALVSLLGKVPNVEIVEKCQDAIIALQLLHSEKIDLVFLDIEMPELSGLEMLGSLSNPPPIILTTAYREYAVQAFELDVIDYLVKPISLERLLKAINRYHDRMSGNDKGLEVWDNSADGIITIYSDKKNHIINTSDILYIEGLKDYAMVYTQKGRLVTRQTMKVFEESLSSYDFIRVHRSWIVPYKQLSGWTTHSVSVGEKEIPVGKTYRKSVFDYLANKSK